MKAAEPFYIDVDYYEQLEFHSAKSYVDFAENGLCAVSVNEYGKGRAFYVAAENNAELLTWLLESLTDELDLKRGLTVPDGVQARKIAEGQYFYVNTTGQEISVPLEEAGYGVLAEQVLERELVLPAYGAELVVRRNMMSQ